jgi:SAM-dependent methyltransferase
MPTPLQAHHQDPAYLRRDQYADGRNLAARAAIYQRFSSNPMPWPEWVFGQLALRPGGHVLECGCGPGHLWHEHGRSLPPGVQLTLTDLSTGMLALARRALAAARIPAQFAAADIRFIPTPAAAFDLVIANHMLYHVPDRPAAFAEVRRVLGKNGRFLAATNGSGHLQELEAVAALLFPGGEAEQRVWFPDFALDDGAEQLAAHFAHIEQRRYANTLHITDPAALVAYFGSTSSGRSAMTPANTARAVEMITAVIAREGAYTVTTNTGLFLAWG